MAIAGKVAPAIRRELRRLAERDADLAASALAATALTLAKELDDPENSATSKSMCAKALNETMEKLLALAPVEEEKDGLDELTSRREQRRGGTAA